MPTGKSNIKPISKEDRVVFSKKELEKMRYELATLKSHNIELSRWNSFYRGMLMAVEKACEEEGGSPKLVQRIRMALKKGASVL